MNYNEYDSNGNKNKFNLSEVMNDRTQRSRFLLLVYLILFIALVIFVRTNLNTNEIQNENKDDDKKVNDTVAVDEEPSDELSEPFSFIDLNNYNFDYVINIGNSLSIIEGKRYNDKFSFTINNSGSVLYFNGTSNYIRAKESLDGESKLTGFPYVLINFFDTKVLKDLIKNSILIEDKYEISNESISKITKNTLINPEDINTIELIKSNGKIIQINLDMSNAISAYMKDNVDVSIVLKYSNFGLIDDFIIE